MNYFRSKIPMIDTGIDLYITIFCLIFLSIMRIYGLQLNYPTREAVSTAISCFVIMLLYIAFSILHSMDIFSNIVVEDVLCMLFILINSDGIRRASLRMFRIAVASIEVLMILASILLAFACLARVLFFGRLWFNNKISRISTRISSTMQCITSQASTKVSTR